MAYQVASFDVLQRATVSPESPVSRYDGLKPEIVNLQADFQKTPEHRAFRASTIFERDIEVPLRDGTKLRADIFRPADSASNVPALVAWSPYGKSGTGMAIDSPPPPTPGDLQTISHRIFQLGPRPRSCWRPSEQTLGL